MRLSSNHLLNKIYIIDMINFLKRYSKKSRLFYEILETKKQNVHFQLFIILFFPKQNWKEKTHTFFCPYNCEFLLAFKKILF